MDEEIRRSIRNLGRGLHAGQFTTRETLQMLQISKVYIVSGIFHGFFFSPEEVVAWAQRQQQAGHLLLREQLHQIEGWAASDSRGNITLLCPGLYDWFPSSQAPVLGITIIDLDAVRPTCYCGDKDFVTQTDEHLMTGKCPNDDCEKVPCIHCVLMCYFCGQDMCEGCSTGWVDKDGIFVNADDIRSDNDNDRFPYSPVCRECGQRRS